MKSIVLNMEKDLEKEEDNAPLIKVYIFSRINYNLPLAKSCSATTFPLLELGKFTLCSKLFCLIFTVKIPIFYFIYTIYFDLLIFCSQNVATHTS